MPLLGPLALLVTLACDVVSVPGSSTLPLATNPPAEPVQTLEVAAPAPAPQQPAPAAMLRSPPPPDLPALWGTVSVAGLAPSVFHVRASGSTRTGAGLALLPVIGRGWALPAAGSTGQMARFGGAISPVEATLDKTANVLVWPLEGHAATGPRVPLGGSRFLYALAGFDGVLRRTGMNDEGAQRRRAYLHVPEISVGVQSKTREALWEIGPLGGLAVVGQDSVRFRADTPLAGADTYTLRPYAGALASFAGELTTVTLDVHRAFLAGGGAGFDDRVRALVCRSFTEVRHGSGLGPCLSADVGHARGAGAATMTSYEVSLRVGGVIIGR